MNSDHFEATYLRGLINNFFKTFVDGCFLLLFVSLQFLCVHTPVELACARWFSICQCLTIFPLEDHSTTGMLYNLHQLTCSVMSFVGGRHRTHEFEVVRVSSFFVSQQPPWLIISEFFVPHCCWRWKVANGNPLPCKWFAHLDALNAFCAQSLTPAEKTMKCMTLKDSRKFSMLTHKRSKTRLHFYSVIGWLHDFWFARARVWNDRVIGQFDIVVCNLIDATVDWCWLFVCFHSQNDWICRSSPRTFCRPSCD